MVDAEALTAHLRTLAREHREHRDRYSASVRDALPIWLRLELMGEPLVDLPGPPDPLMDWLARLIIPTKQREDAVLRIGGWSLRRPRPELGMLRLGSHFTSDVWVRPETHGLHFMHMRGAYPDESSGGSSVELFSVLPILAEYQVRARPDLPNDQLHRLRDQHLKRALAVAPSLDHRLRSDLADWT